MNFDIKKLVDYIENILGDSTKLFKNDKVKTVGIGFGLDLLNISFEILDYDIKSQKYNK